MSLFDKLIEGLGNIESTIYLGHCELCRKECEKIIEISIRKVLNHEFLLDVGLCEGCFKGALEVILDD